MTAEKQIYKLNNKKQRRKFSIGCVSNDKTLFSYESDKNITGNGIGIVKAELLYMK